MSKHTHESRVNVNTAIPYLCSSPSYHVYTALLILPQPPKTSRPRRIPTRFFFFSPPFVHSLQKDVSKFKRNLLRFIGYLHSVAPLAAGTSRQSETFFIHFMLAGGTRAKAIVM